MARVITAVFVTEGTAMPKLSILTASALAVVTVAATTAASATAPTAGEGPQHKRIPAVSGSGHVYSVDGQDRIFSFQASGLAVDGYEPAGVPGTRGTFTVEHYSDHGHANGVVLRGHVDCLIVGGGVATFTGVIDKATAFGVGQPDVSSLVGVRRGFSVAHPGHGRRDRIGYSWLINPEDTTSTLPCQGPAPFSYIDEGGFRTTEWLPPEVTPSDEG
jgi:hypothetical protein